MSFIILPIEVRTFVVCCWLLVGFSSLIPFGDIGCAMVWLWFEFKWKIKIERLSFMYSRVIFICTLGKLNKKKENNFMPSSIKFYYEHQVCGVVTNTQSTNKQPSTARSSNNNTNAAHTFGVSFKLFGMWTRRAF